ncbi:MAG: hypothetical protein AB1330_01870 [Bacillota bacterium]
MFVDIAIARAAHDAGQNLSSSYSAVAEFLNAHLEHTRFYPHHRISLPKDFFIYLAEHGNFNVVSWILDYELPHEAIQILVRRYSDLKEWPPGHFEAIKRGFEQLVRCRFLTAEDLIALEHCPLAADSIEYMSSVFQTMARLQGENCVLYPIVRRFLGDAVTDKCDYHTRSKLKQLVVRYFRNVRDPDLGDLAAEFLQFGKSVSNDEMAPFLRTNLFSPGVIAKIKSTCAGRFKSKHVLAAIGAHSCTPVPLLTELFSSSFLVVRDSVLLNVNAPPHILEQAYKRALLCSQERREQVFRLLAQNPNCPDDILMLISLSGHGAAQVAQRVLSAKANRTTEAGKEV